MTNPISHRSGGSPGTDYDVRAQFEASAWLRQERQAIRARITSGVQGTCGHVRPDRGHIALWADPGITRCPACVQKAARAIAGTVADRRCDRCGEIVDEIDALAWTPPQSSAVVHLGLCPSCSARELTR